MYKQIAIILLLAISSLCSSQDLRSFAYYDSITLKNYNDASWKILKENASDAISKGYDYYYMRMRIGISYYERGFYLSAAKHFKKALEFNSGDQIALEYLYYCYLFSNRGWIAYSVSKDFGNTTLKKTGLDAGNKNRVSVDFLMNKADGKEIINDYINSGELSDAGTLSFPVAYSNMGVSMSHLLKSGNGLVHTLSYLRRNNTLFISNGTNDVPDYAQVVQQFQYNISPVFAWRSGIVFSPSLYYLNTSYDIVEFSSMGMGGPTAYELRIRENNLGAGFHLAKNFGILDVKGSAYFSQIGKRNHFQFGGDITLFPAGNNLVYFGAGLYYKSSEIIDSRDNANIYRGVGGVSIRNKFFVDFAAYFGDLQNFVENKGAIIYNGINKVDQLYSIDFSIPISDSGVIIYAGSRLMSEYSAFIPEDYYFSTESIRNISSLSIVGGLSWTF